VAGRVPDEKIDEVRDRADIVQVVSRHVALRKAGRGFTGLCPFHHEKTPSFHVNPDRQTFHCFGCGVGGNVFTFLMRVEGATFPEALERLARELGIELPRRVATAADSRAREERERLLAITAAARAWFRERLAANAAASAYLEERGLSRETIDRFAVGYAEDDWEGLANHLKRSGVSLPLAEKAGLLIARRGSGHYDRFRHRIMFPIEDLNGNTVGFGGRALGDAKTAGDDAKYLNTPETPLYDKGRVLFGLRHARDAVRREERALVVEGYFDAILLFQAGIENVVAPCGTALTAEQVRILRRFTRDLVTLFDADEAGRRATERAMHLFIEEGVQGLGVVLPEGMDPDDTVRKEGADALRRRVEAARPLLEEWVIRETKGPLSLTDRARRAEAIAAVLGKIQGRIERDLYIRMAAERLAVDERLMRESAGRDRSQTSAPRGSAAVSGPAGASAGATASAAPEPPADPWDAKIARAEEELLTQILREPGLLLDPGVEETLAAFTSPSARGAAVLLREAGTAVAAALVDRTADPALGSLVTRLASLEAPLDERPPLEIFRAAAWELDRMRLEREVRNLSREMHDRERQGELPAELLRRKADLTRELGKYKGIDGGRAPSGSRE